MCYPFYLNLLSWYLSWSVYHILLYYCIYIYIYIYTYIYIYLCTYVPWQHKQHSIVILHFPIGSMMSLVSLDGATRRYYLAGLAASPHKTYLAAERCYLDFCESFSIAALPTSESTLCYFVMCLVQHGLSECTIWTYLSGVRQLQISYGFQEPYINQMPHLRQILWGIKVERGNEGGSQCSRLPITPMILRRMKPHWITDQPSFNSMVTFISFCRFGETTVGNDAKYDPNTHLSYSDVTVDDPTSPSIVSLFIKRSKTDQERVGVKDLCPVSGPSGLSATAWECPWSFVLVAGPHTSIQSTFVMATRQALTVANLPAQDFAGHSYRIGAATTAAINDSTIQTLGRWKSAAYCLYVRLDPQHLAAVHFVSPVIGVTFLVVMLHV